MKKRVALSVCLALGALFCACDGERDEVEETIDFMYDDAQTIVVANESASALTITGSALYASVDDAGTVQEFVYDAKCSSLTLAAGESGTIGFRSVVGLYSPTYVSWEATFSYGGKTLVYAGFPETAKRADDTTARADYALMYEVTQWQEATATSAPYGYPCVCSRLHNDGKPIPLSDTKCQLRATVRDDGVAFSFPAADATE